MRILVALWLLCGIASAEPKLQRDIGDWTLFSGERKGSKGMVAERTLAVVVVTHFHTQTRVMWLRGEPDKEEHWSTSYDDTSDTSLHIPLFRWKPKKVEAATCKLDTAFACSKVIYDGQDLFTRKDRSVVAKMSDRIRGTGIVELEVLEGTEVLWRLKVIGYGTGKKAAWGKSPASLPTSPAEAPAMGREETDMFRQIDIGHDEPGPKVKVPGEVGKLEATGDLDKAIIRRYLKRNLGKLAYCYEKELVAKPKLKGTIEITFQITPAGNVASSTGKGIDPEVEKCAAGVVKGIEFPKPKGSSKVDVTFAIDYEPPAKP